MIIEFFGKFHPLLVHLPIGFFLLAFVLKIYSFWRQKDVIDAILPLILGLSILASVFSSVTGYLLSQSGEYDLEMVNDHQWTAIGFTIILCLFYFLRNYQKVNLLFWIGLSVLLMVVGHLGGSLTHGEGFLNLTKAVEKNQIVDVQNAKVYEDLVRPIFEEKCYACHSSKKQKGKLRLDSQIAIEMGGKNKNLIIPHEVEKSLLSQRLFLKDSDEEHMPPKGKPQLTNEELKIINWWIKEGASFDKKVSEIPQSAEIKTTLLRFQKGSEIVKSAQNIPEKEVEKALEEKIEILKNAGILALPVAANSNYLLINMRGISPQEKEIEAMKSLKKQIIWFNAANVKNTKSWSEVLKDLTEISILHLNKTEFSDEEMKNLQGLANLQTLNLSNTQVTEKGLESLKDHKKLQKVFLYKSKTDFSKLDFNQFPNIKIDTGGYKVPTFEMDTVEVKAM
ncbi:hypothetical protein EGI22_00150 [Lacihabitans sp. LS3-19]|uniref:c-type cytochrome domain-containing protein n=1 Tax=Lacihabitans sp. LS3-19 TaxID=2487335 RepID=UPI0020CD5A99|nr:c-type cytochrome domain-containing protein [Lacihabitans sp. LS3-19]MCP9766297.1 hypothetical protein [Lacihabitans sp. LS3-19]